MVTYDLIVVGEGISGLTCAGHAARAGLKVATFEAEFFGGLVVNVNELEGLGGGHAVSGMDLAADLMNANAKAGALSIQASVTKIRSYGTAFEVTTDEGGYVARVVVIASGARLKRLGVPGEADFEGRGVSRCADCDGPLFHDADVVVVGGGDSAAQEALVLAPQVRSVRMIHDGRQLRARRHLAERVAAEPKITVVPESTVDAVLGSNAVEAVRVRSIATGKLGDVPCAGIFTYIGLEPNASFVPPNIARDTAGFVVVDENLETAISGIWAIGQVRAGYGGRLRDAVDEACHAVNSVRARLALSPIVS